jgi:hypothetical protein
MRALRSTQLSRRGRRGTCMSPISRIAASSSRRSTEPSTRKTCFASAPCTSSAGHRTDQRTRFLAARRLSAQVGPALQIARRGTAVTDCGRRLLAYAPPASGSEFAPSGALMGCARSSHEKCRRAAWSSCRSRTIWAAPQPRAARPPWSESGGRGGVSDLGGGEQPTAEASAASTSGPPSARTRNVAPCARRTRDARWNKSD